MRTRWGSLLAIPMLLGWSLPGVAAAHAKPHLHLKISAVDVSHLKKVVLTATLSQPIKGVRYTFWEKSVGGTWHHLGRKGYGRKTYLAGTAPGTFWVEARALVRQNHGWSTLAISRPESLYVGAYARLAAFSSVAQGSTEAIRAFSGRIVHPLYQFSYQLPGGQWTTEPFGPASAFNPPTATPGVYHARVAVKTPGGRAMASRAVTWDVFGPAASLTMTLSTAKQEPWVADGLEQGKVMVTVVDAEGDVVTNYNGTGIIMDGSPAGAIQSWGPAQTVLGTQPASQTLTFRNGLAHVTIQAGTTPAADSLTAALSAPASAVTGALNVTAVAQTATGVQVVPEDTYMIANESGNPATFGVSVTDQAGEPMLSGSYNLTATLIGPGQFHDLTQGPDIVTYAGMPSPAPTPVTVYSMAGSTGNVVLDVSGAGLGTGSGMVPAILGGQPDQMGVSASDTTLQDGQNTTLTLTQLTKQGGVCDPASLDNSGYVVTILDSNGNPATGFALDGAPYTGSQQFAVAAGPNDFYAVSQPVTLTAVTAAPGTYTVIVSDADSLWQASQPLTIDISN